jgi:hypothetical protein
LFGGVEPDGVSGVVVVAWDGLFWKFFGDWRMQGLKGWPTRRKSGALLLTHSELSRMFTAPQKRQSTRFSLRNTTSSTTAVDSWVEKSQLLEIHQESTQNEEITAKS